MKTFRRKRVRRAAHPPANLLCQLLRYRIIVWSGHSPTLSHPAGSPPPLIEPGIDCQPRQTSWNLAQDPAVATVRHLLPTICLFARSQAAKQ